MRYISGYNVALTKYQGHQNQLSPEKTRLYSPRTAAVCMPMVPDRQPIVCVCVCVCAQSFCWCRCQTNDSNEEELLLKAKKKKKFVFLNYFLQLFEIITSTKQVM